MTNLEFQPTWVDFPGEIELPSQVTWGELKIWGDDQFLTRNESLQEPGQIRDFVEGELVGVADWFIENWEHLLWEIQTPFPNRSASPEVASARSFPSLRDATDGWIGFDSEPSILAEWQSRHTVGHPNTDLALPSIIVVPEMRHIIVEVDDLPGTWDPDVRFIDDAGVRRSTLRFVLRKDAFKRSIIEFVDSVLERTQAGQFKEWSDWMFQEWAEAQKREREPGTRLRAMLGELSATKVEKWITDGRPDIAHGLKELLVDCRQLSDQDEASEIEKIVRERSTATRKTTPEWKKLRKRPQSTIPAHRQGYELATIVREHLGIEDKAIVDLSMLLSRLDICLDEPVPTELFRTAVVAPSHGEAHLLRSSRDSRMNHLTSSRFAIVAALGRLVWSQGTGRDQPIISGAHGDYSRLLHTQRANAFAAEFLLPASAFSTPDNRNLRTDELNDLAEEYGISRTAATWHAYNRGCLESLPT